MSIFPLFQRQLTTFMPAQRHFLLGLSGGVDSVVLLHLLVEARQRFGLKVRAVHIHHGLSSNADQWADFCQRLCDQFTVPLTICKVKVEGKNGLEANARQARYQAIQRVINVREMLVTAHHLDDQAETFLLAVKRGSGVKGLSAMQGVSAWQNFAIFRPLLAVRKADILLYAKHHQLQWVEDESNQQNDYDRNFLRNEVLPQLNGRWQHFSEMVARVSQHCHEQQQLLEELLAPEVVQRHDVHQRSFNYEGFQHYSRLKQQQLIRLWLAQCEIEMPSTAQLSQILNTVILAEQDKNPQLQLGNFFLRRYQQKIYLCPPLTPLSAMELPLPPIEQSIRLPQQLGEIVRHSQGVDYKKSGKIARLRLPEVLWNAPLILKIQQQGKVECYGKPHREEMKKIWQQYQIPPWLRDRTPIIFWQGKLVGVLGNGIDKDHSN